MVAVVQFGRAADCDSVCRGFEPRQRPHFFTINTFVVQNTKVTLLIHRVQLNLLIAIIWHQILILVLVFNINFA